MHSAAHAAFNASWSPRAYAAFLHEMHTTYRWPVDYRIAESPLFLDAVTARELAGAAEGIVRQLRGPEFRRHAETAIPAGLAVPGEERAPHPVFLQVDFALCDDGQGRITPRLIELQGFPSIYCYQPFLISTYRRHFAVPADFTPHFGGLDEGSYVRLLRRVIVGDADPEEVVLLEITPEHQKTRIDFACTEAMLGVRPVCVTAVKKRGRALFHERDGREVPIRRIYNRCIFDELLRKQPAMAFSFQDDLDVEWVGHPNWYFRISKHTLPFLRTMHTAACSFVSDLKEYPAGLGEFVLKPLFSFAGQGVELDVTAARLDAIPVADRRQFLLQKKVAYTEVLPTLDGQVSKAEVRMMFIWEPGAEPRLVNNLVRLSQGRMLGVDFNKNKTWVGSSGALFPRA